MNGLIYGALVLMWAVVLLPMWVRRHDEASEANSMDRFTTAMRVLSRRNDDPGTGGNVGHREVVMPARTQRRDVTVQGRPARKPVRSSAAVVAARRRRTLIVLLLLIVLVGAAAWFGYLPMYAVAVPAVLAVAYLVHLRAEAKRAADRARRHDAARMRARRRYADDAYRARYLPAYASSTAHAAQQLPTAPEPDVLGMVEQPAALVSDGGEVWQPVPVPLPTYVTAPPASHPVRVIDLTKPGAWASRHVGAEAEPEVEQEAVAPEREQIVDPATPDRGETRPDRRRAVGD